MIYFVKMAQGFYKILSLKIRKNLFYCPMLCLTFCITVTLFRSEIYGPISMEIFGANPNNYRLFDIMEILNFVMMYIAKLTPILISSFIHTIVYFLSPDKNVQNLE